MTDTFGLLEAVVERNPVVVSSDAKVLDAIAKMSRQSDLGFIQGRRRSLENRTAAIRYVVIVDHDQVVGCLTERDIERLVAQQNVPLDVLTLRQILRHSPITARASGLTDLIAVFNIFQQHQLSHLPIVDHTYRLVGVVSAADLHQLLSSRLVEGSAYSAAHTATHTAAELALQDTQKQFRHLAGNIPGMIYRLVRHFDGHYELTYVSPQVREMFEVEPEAILQNINLFWERIYSDDLDWLYAEFQASASRLKPFSREHRLRLPRKGLRWGKMIARPERLDNGDVVWDGIVLDISDRKRAKAELKQTSQDLDRATRLKDEFLANVSYELRTPLNTILGMIEGLKDGVFGQLNRQQLKMLDTIEQSGTHQLDVINEVLDLAKIESGMLELSYSAAAVTPLCQSSLAFVKQKAQEKGIQLYLKSPWNLPDIRIDEHRIRQVLINLLIHAVDATAEGGHITLEVVPSPLDKTQIQHYLRFVVIDADISISLDTLNHLFPPCAQIEEDSRQEREGDLNHPYEDSDLGLAFVERVVSLHGGHVSVISEPGVGHCFAIELPYDTTPMVKSSQGVEQDARPALRPLSFEHLPPITPPAESPLVLLAEDNEANIMASSSYLKAKGYRIQVAKNGQSALDLAQVDPPHIILMDIQMPGMDGITAIQHMRQVPSLEKIPIIALTAFAMEGDQARCLAAGADKYLSKPVKLKQLVLSIQELIVQ